MNIPGGSGLAEWVVKAVIQYQEEIKPLRLALERQKRLCLAGIVNAQNVCQLCHLLSDPSKEIRCDKCGNTYCNECDTVEFEQCEECDEYMCPICVEMLTETCESCGDIFCEDCMEDHYNEDCV